MSVYVDRVQAAYGRMVMCHMIGDSPDELHAMADRIGVARKWFQRKPSGDHYDIALSKRALAIAFGVREITLRQCAMMCANRRHGGTLGDPETAEAVFRARLRMAINV